MTERLNKHIDLLMERYPALAVIKTQIIAAYDAMEKSYENGGKLLLGGNGGSAADCEHIAGELMKGFKFRRRLSKVEQDALTAVDPVMGAELARQVTRCASLYFACRSYSARHSVS